MNLRIRKPPEIVRNLYDEEFKDMEVREELLKDYIAIKTGGAKILGKGGLKTVYELKGKAVAVENAVNKVDARTKIARSDRLKNFVRGTPWCDVILIPDARVMIEDEQNILIVSKYNKCYEDDLFDVMINVGKVPRDSEAYMGYLTDIVNVVNAFLGPISAFLKKACDAGFYFTDIKLENMLRCPCGDGETWVLSDLEEAANPDDLDDKGMLVTQQGIPTTYLYNRQRWKTADDLERQTFYGVIVILFMICQQQQWNIRDPRLVWMRKFFPVQWFDPSTEPANNFMTVVLQNNTHEAQSVPHIPEGEDVYIDSTALVAEFARVKNEGIDFKPIRWDTIFYRKSEPRMKRPRLGLRF